MVEQKDGENNQTAEDLKKELLAYLEDADFGTPKYQALGDFLNLQELEQSLGKWQDFLMSESDARRKAYLESEMRIDEMQIALLRHKIENSRLTIKGYGPAYTQIGIAIEDSPLGFWQEGEKSADTGQSYGSQKSLRSILWDEYYKREEEFK